MKLRHYLINGKMQKKIIILAAAVLFLGLAQNALADCQSTISFSPTPTYKGWYAALYWNVTGSLDPYPDGSGNPYVMGQCTGQAAHSISFSYEPPGVGIQINQDTTCSVWGYSGGTQCGLSSATVALKCDAAVSWSPASVAYNGQSTRTITTAHADSATYSCSDGTSGSLTPNQTQTDPFYNLTASKTCTVQCFVNSQQRGQAISTVTVASPAGSGQIRVSARTSSGAAVPGATWTIRSSSGGFLGSSHTSQTSYSNAGYDTYTLTADVPAGYTLVSIKDANGTALSVTNNSASLQLCGASPGACGGNVPAPAPTSPVEQLNFWKLQRVFAQTGPYIEFDLVYAAPNTGTVSVAAFGVDSSSGGKPNLPISWTLTGPGGFSDSVTASPSKTYTNMALGGYTIQAPTKVYDPANGVSYLLSSMAAPCNITVSSFGTNITQSCTQTLESTSAGTTPAPPSAPPPNPGPINPRPGGPQLIFKWSPRNLANLPGWFTAAAEPVARWARDIIGGAPLPVSADSVPGITFTFYYKPGGNSLSPCGASCDPLNTVSEGNLSIQPGVLYQGTPHTVKIVGVPNANAVLSRTIYEWDNLPPSGPYNSRRQLAGYRTNFTEASGVTGTPFNETTALNAWHQLPANNSSANPYVLNFTNDCSNDGAGVPTLGYRLEADWLQYAGTDLSSPVATVVRDCRGTVKIVTNTGTPRGISWSLTGMSNWQPDKSKTAVPITNQNVDGSQNNGQAFQNYSAPNISTITFAATAGSYNMTGLLPGCSVDYPSQPVFPSQTTTFNITCGNTDHSLLACTPTSQSVQPNAWANLTASGGNGAYTWSAPGAGKTSGQDTMNFSVQYPTIGTNKVTLSSGGQTASCTVNVGACTGSPTLVCTPPSQSVPVGGNATFQALYDQDGPSCPAPNQDVTASVQWVSENSSVGQIIQPPGTVHGASGGTAPITVRQTSINGLSAACTLIVNGHFQCAVTPTQITVAQGDSTGGTITCTPLNGWTGTIGFLGKLPQGPPNSVIPPMSPVSGKIPPNALTSSYTLETSLTTPPGAYTIFINAKSGASDNYDYPVQVTVTPVSNTVTANLAADPASGNAPLQSALTGTTSAAPAGKTDFTFWGKCGYQGTEVNQATAQCGAPSAAFANRTETSISTDYTYPSPGNYTALFIAKRTAAGGAVSSAYATAPVKVTLATHAECSSSGACVQIANSPGNTKDRCGSDADCTGLCPDGTPVPPSGVCPGDGGGDTCSTAPNWNDGTNYLTGYIVRYVPNGDYYKAKQNNLNHDPSTSPAYWELVDCSGTGDFHGECSAAENACVNMAGPLPPGTPDCASDPKCGGGTKTHLECQNYACVIVGGNPPSDDTGCVNKKVGDACVGQPPTGACTIAANPKVIKSGDNSTVTWACGAGIKNCSLSGPSILSQGSGTAVVKPPKTSQYTLTCNRGTYSVPVTVYVIQSFKEVPPAGQ